MDVQRVLVVGAGTMGSGIAYAAAVAGFEVRLHDVSAELAERGARRIESLLSRGVERGKVRPEEKSAALSRLSVHQDLAAASSDVQLAIETVTERIDVKQNVFRQLDDACPPDAVLATNTSSLSITEMAAATRRPQNVAGMHFFNPVHRMRLVEIVKGLETSATTLALVSDAARRMGKEVVTVNEYPGFVTSRINALIGNEAFYMLQEGVASAEDIDRALKLGLNHPMGPFEMIDMVGLDVRLGVLSYLHASLGEKYRPAPLLVRYVKSGRLGRKVGKGVYEYDETGARREVKGVGE